MKRYFKPVILSSRYSSISHLNDSVINIGDWIRKWSSLQPRKRALIFEDRPFTHQELNLRTNQLCHLLLDLGVKKETEFPFFFTYISGGENVYPAEIEKVLHTHPKIFEAGIVGVPDEKWGEVGKAFIVLKPGETMSNGEALEFLKGKVAKYKIPKYVEFIKELPKTASGKIQKFLLKERHKAGGLKSRARNPGEASLRDQFEINPNDQNTKFKT